MSMRTGARRILTAAAVIGVTLAGSFAMASPAQANSKWGCTYPRVCFYLTGNDWSTDHPTASFQDVTSGYQTLGSQSRGSYGVYNTRNDDIAYLHFTNGTTHCLGSNSFMWAQQYGTVDKIRISSASSC